MEKLSFKLEVYEGPLDLLLDMIKNSKVDILEIHISDILEQYLLYLTTMHQMNLELTADFLVMASHLLLIKSKMLLPKAETQDGDDPRKVLIDTLLEYQKCKQNTEILLRLRTSCGDTYVKSSMEIEIQRAYRENMPIAYLVKAYESIINSNQRKMPPKVNSFVKIVGRERFSVGMKISQLFEWFKNSKILDFNFLFSIAKSRSEMVATFLAVLEMAKSKKINILEDDDLNYKIEYKNN